MGLVGAYGPDGGWSAAATWTDQRCRQVDIYLLDSGAHVGTPVGRERVRASRFARVGPWALVLDLRRGWHIPELGATSLLEYQTSVSEGVVDLQVIGIPRTVADRIVRSIPT